jgi:excisionase family DNA binding protein
MTTGQVAEFLGRSPETIRRLEAKGLLTSTRIAGGHRRFDPRDVLRLATSQPHSTPQGGQ